MNANRNPASNSRHQRTSLCRIDISLHFSTSARSHNPAIPGDTPGPSESQQLASVKLGPMSARTSRSVYHFANQSANPLTILHVAPPIEALKVTIWGEEPLTSFRLTTALLFGFYWCASKTVRFPSGGGEILPFSMRVNMVRGVEGFDVRKV